MSFNRRASLTDYSQLLTLPFHTMCLSALCSKNVWEFKGISRSKVKACFSYWSSCNPSSRLLAVNFLLNHGFSMGAPFRRGVPYLSREEEKEATEATIALQNRVFADILLETHDTQALRTVNKTRAEIIRWETLTVSRPCIMQTSNL